MLGVMTTQWGWIPLAPFPRIEVLSSTRPCRSKFQRQCACEWCFQRRRYHPRPLRRRCESRWYVHRARRGGFASDSHEGAIAMIFGCRVPFTMEESQVRNPSALVSATVTSSCPRYGSFGGAFWDKHGLGGGSSRLVRGDDQRDPHDVSGPPPHFRMGQC